jgi:hypothetical protein
MHEKGVEKEMFFLSGKIIYFGSCSESGSAEPQI